MFYKDMALAAKYFVGIITYKGLISAIKTRCFDFLFSWRGFNKVPEVAVLEYCVSIVTEWFSCNVFKNQLQCSSTIPPLHKRMELCKSRLGQIKIIQENKGLLPWQGGNIFQRAYRLTYLSLMLNPTLVWKWNSHGGWTGHRQYLLA